MILKTLNGAIRNYFQRRAERHRTTEAMYERALKFWNQYSTQLVQGIGSTQLTNYANTPFDAEFRYGTHIWLYVAIKTIAEKGSQAPLVLKNSEGEMMDAPLPDVPNPCLSWTECRELLSVWLELTGNAYLYHDKEMDEFWPLRPSRVKIVAADDGCTVQGYTYYKGGAYRLDEINILGSAAFSATGSPFKASWMYDNPELDTVSKKEFKRALENIRTYERKGTMSTMGMKDRRNWVALDAEEVLHFKYVSPTHSFYGLSPLTPLLVSLETDLYTRQWNQKFFENGAIPPGLLIVPSQMSAADFMERKRAFHREYAGAENRGKPIVIQGGPEGAQYQAFPSQHREFEFIEGLKIHRDEVLAIYNVPHVMVNAQLSASHAGSLSPGMDTLKRLFWRDTIMPKHRRTQAVWDKHFDFGGESEWRFAHDYSDIEDLAPNYVELSKAAAVAIRSGMTIQEVRSLIYQLPEDWDGDLLLPKGVSTLETATPPMNDPEDA